MKVRQIYFALISLNLLFTYSLDVSTIVLAINSGGSAYTSSFGFSYSDDIYYTPATNKVSNLAGINIADTVDEFIYQSERWNSETWGYDLPISTDGTYVLILQFAEIIFSAANYRVFTVKIGDYVVANNLDLYATVGYHIAYDIFTTFTLSNNTILISGNTVSGAYSGGNLLVRFYLVVENPKLSGIVLVSGDCSVADYCNMCYQARCLVCNVATLTCTTCITNASIISGVCQCNLGTYWDASSRKCIICDKLCSSCSDKFSCTTCLGANVLVSNVCLRACPYGFGASCASVSSAVIDQNFANYFYGAYGLFQTGTSSSSYYFFNNPEVVDPIPAKNRGLYFSGGSYLQTASTVYISLNFSIGMWVWILSDSGDILTNSSGYKITISSSGSMTIVLESNIESMTTVMTAVLNPSNSAWVYISFIISFSPSTSSTTIAPSLNNSPQTSTTSNGYIYRDAVSNALILGKSSSSNFFGYIYQFTLWNVAVSNFNTQYSDQICGAGAINSCLWTCPLSQWMNEVTPTNCNSCTNGCVRNESCNVCEDPLCSVCTGFLVGLCIQCISNASGTPCACNIGYYWDLTSNKCLSCDYSCKTCTSSTSGDCIVCASAFYMYLGWCISKCPDGFIESGSSCVEKDSFIFYLSFDTLEGVVFDKQSKIPALTGNSTAFYPDYDDFDPIAALYRGFYFNGMNSVMHLPIYPGYNSPALSFGYSFTFSIWVNIENGFGIILSKQDLLYNPIFSLQLSAGVLVVSLNFKSSGLTSFYYLQSVESYEWNHVAFTAEYTSLKRTKMAFYLNGIQDDGHDFGYDYFKDIKTDITFTLGAEKDLFGYKNYFKGFIYDIKGYNSVKSISALALPAVQCTENCKACLTNEVCIPNCLISQYWVGPEYNKCSKCSSECLSCRDSSEFCDLCDNQKCASCYDFTGDSCLECVSGTSNTTNCQCDYDLAWNTSSGMCETCHQWQYKANDSCYDCPPLCTQCDIKNKCKSCINNAVLNSGSCACSPGYIGTTSCTFIPFNVSLVVNKNNTLVLAFSDMLKKGLNHDQIMMQIHNNKILSWSISQISSKEYLISCNFDGGISKGTTITVHFINSTSIVSISGGVIHEDYLSDFLYESLTSEEQEVAQIQNQVSSGVKVFVGSSVALAMFSPNPSALWTMLNTIQFISYIPYASYPLTDKISAFLKSMSDFNLVPNLFLLFIDENQSNPPYYQARKYGYDSLLILVNVGNDITALCCVITAIPIVYFFYKCSQRFIGKKFKKLFREYKFSAFLRFWIVCYLEIGFASIIGVLSTEDYEILENPLRLSNYFICWFFIVMII
ncbi:unnamed protein product [Blepharisma stoltei]|uniref:Malectin domain-containing protein n=1 Tax=Blepharisma stoltei TaxID=1481888 RepID=A0AAU9IE15_9CILI|nr:unnamed protein product [Blepharisma stoltei]